MSGTAAGEAGQTLIDALPVGIALYDGERRLLHANPAFARILGVSPGLFRPLSTLADNMRLVAYRGLFGPGDPDLLTRRIAVDEIGKERRFAGQHKDGRSFDAHHLPLPSGGSVLCLLDTTALAQRSHAAEQALAHAQSAAASLDLGVAVVTAAGMLGHHNARFIGLAGLRQAPFPPGVPLAELPVDGPGRLLTADLLQTCGTARRSRGEQLVEIRTKPLDGGGWSLALTDVTALAQAQADAAHSAELLAAIMQQASPGISVFDADHRLVHVNGAYRRIMAGAPGEIGQTLAEIMQARLHAREYDVADPEGYVQAVLSAAPGAPEVRRRRRRNGTTIEVWSTPLPGGGQIRMVEDVSALAEAQAELRRHAELTADIANHVPHGISVYGPDRRLRLVNRAYTEIMAGAPIHVGETVDEIIDRRARSGEYGSGEPAELAQSQRQHDNTRPQYRRRKRPNGRVVDVRTAPLSDGSHLSVVTDVTALISAEAELARRGEAIDAMLATVRHGLVLWNRDRCLITANAPAAAILLLPDGVLVPGRSLADILQGVVERGGLGDGPAARALARRLLEQDRGVTQHLECITRAGRCLELRSEPTLQGGFVTTIVDVTPARDAEDAVRLLHTASGQPVAPAPFDPAAMGQAWRAPLAAIQAEADEAAEALVRAASDPAALDPVRILAACQAIASSTRRMLGELEGRGIAADAARFGLAEDRVDVRTLLRTILRRFDAPAAAAEVTLVVDAPERLPPFRADEQRLLQVLSHLVRNALSQTDPGGSISLTARHDWAQGSLLIEVHDSGGGIPEPDIERAFEPFVQLGAHLSTRAPCAGIGLFVSRLLVRAHGGDLTLRSMTGQGTTAMIRIPAARVLQDGPRDPK